ncbi:hypothetical protein ABTY53_21650 [Streptomyces noursei]|uniref:hypothetical protein n=1 Tax=Streptomyces noursei TaxID=1971 RepID=UPI00333403BF
MGAFEEAFIDNVDLKDARGTGGADHVTATVPVKKAMAALAGATEDRRHFRQRNSGRVSYGRQLRVCRIRQRTVMNGVAGERWNLAVSLVRCAKPAT